ncbi:hypothetical protein [Paenibacillus dendritiformis]|uniref:hypothetical protein n=1 Tax=Paenibacillus dendritiformis TaxID=130049 RepID=UPI0020B8B883|nr:hypothetical protein [Paenibacillus dendritiformis]
MAVQKHPPAPCGANPRCRVRLTRSLGRLQPEDIDARLRSGGFRTLRRGVTPPLTVSGGMIGVQADTAAQFQTLHRLVPRSSWCS